MHSLTSIYRRVTNFTPRCVLPLLRCSCPVLTKGRDHNSDCSQLLSTENTWERRVFVIAVCSCCWTGPLLFSFTLWPHICFSHLFSDHLAVHGKAEAEFTSQSKSRQQSVFFLVITVCLLSAVQTGSGHPWCKSTDVKKAVTLKGYLSVEYMHLGQQQTKRTLRSLTLLLPARLWDPRCLDTHCFSHLHVILDSHKLPSCYSCSSCFHSARWGH